MGFGDFQTICSKAAIPLCALVGHQDINGGVGIQTRCFSRTIELANTLIFEPANDFVHIAAMIMTVIMIIHVRSKFTAVGMWRLMLDIALLRILTGRRAKGDHLLLLYLPSSDCRIACS